MESHVYIQKALDYIEENLTQDLNTALLAQVAGYSKYHFLRIFKSLLHLTPADYIRKRRISEIVFRMATENRPIADIAFEFGFNSKENFVRAFKREHHILPTDYRSALNSLKLYSKIDLHPSAFSVSVSIVTLQPFQLVTYKSTEEFPPQFWNLYNVNQYSKKLSGGLVVEDYGVSDWKASDNHLDYYIGIRKENAHGDLANTITLTIPGGLYAVFDTPPATNFNFVSTIHRTWDYIVQWLSQNGFDRTGSYEFETYIEESRTFSEKIYIPIQRRQPK